MREGSWVVKQGRTTKTTIGKVGQMDRIVQWTKDAQNIIGEFREVEVVGLNCLFAYDGASNSNDD